MSRRVVVIGSGIVGAALAAQLSVREKCQVTVVDQAPDGQLLGSTGLAPGLVGQFGAAAVLTELARESVRVYAELRWRGMAGFDRIGGLEIAQSTAAARTLTRRAEAATAVGLPARLLEPAEAAALAPRMVDVARVETALHFPLDGTARAGVITAALCARAESAGARFIPGVPVTAIDLRGNRVTSIQAGGEVLAADDVVIACGIWGPAVAALAGVDLPLTPVTHPYVYGPHRSNFHPPTPFVRWPEHHAYGRDHGDRYGLGSYDHMPVPVPIGQLADRADQPWPGAVFDDAISTAMNLLDPRHRWHVVERLNGLFSMTADNLPLLGGHAGVTGLWSAEAIWVTHAAGAAAALTALMFDEPTTHHLDALNPGRFAHESPGDLQRRALARYRDIYATT